VRLPTSVKVGPLTYRVERFDPREAKHRDLYGHCAHSDQLIQVDDSHGHERAALTVLHEVIHAVIATYAIPVKSSEDEEQLVRGLVAGLGSVLRDSPEVFVFMLEGLSSQRLPEGA
jgi:hypothetical protein